VRWGERFVAYPGTRVDGGGEGGRRVGEGEDGEREGTWPGGGFTRPVELCATTAEPLEVNV